MQQFASIALENEEFQKLEQIVKEYLQMSRPAFLKAIALQFSKQYHSGEIPDWPPKFVVRPDIEEKKAKTNRPKRKSPKKKSKSGKAQA